MIPGSAVARSYLVRQQTLFGDQLLLGEAADSAIEPDSGVNGSQVEELAAFNREIRECQECPLGATRTKFVFGVGNPAADLVLVGEAPGRQEDLQGEPFVGQA